MGDGFPANAHRFDPYKTYMFRIKDGERTVLAVSKVGPLKQTTQVVTYRSGGDNSWERKSPGRTSFDSIMLERGLTHDREFERWAKMVSSWDGDPTKDLVNYKRDLTLEVMNERGQVAMRYYLHDCWVSEYTAMPELDAAANAIAVESLKLEIEGWSRDTETMEPDESEPVPASS
jgi:phage tail-like protein